MTESQTESRDHSSVVAEEIEMRDGRILFAPHNHGVNDPFGYTEKSHILYALNQESEITSDMIDQIEIGEGFILLEGHCHVCLYHEHETWKQSNRGNPLNRFTMWLTERGWGNRIRVADQSAYTVPDKTVKSRSDSQHPTQFPDVEKWPDVTIIINDGDSDEVIIVLNSEPTTTTRKSLGIKPAEWETLKNLARADGDMSKVRKELTEPLSDKWRQSQKRLNLELGMISPSIKGRAIDRGKTKFTIYTQPHQQPDDDQEYGQLVQDQAQEAKQDNIDIEVLDEFKERSRLPAKSKSPVERDKRDD